MCCSRMVRCTCRIMIRKSRRRNLEMLRQLDQQRAVASLSRSTTGSLTPRSGLTISCSVYTRRAMVKATPSPSSNLPLPRQPLPSSIKDSLEDTSLVPPAPIPRSAISQRPPQPHFARVANTPNSNSSWVEICISTSSNIYNN